VLPFALGITEKPLTPLAKTDHNLINLLNWGFREENGAIYP
jgi:hypothetical protein